MKSALHTGDEKNMKKLTASAVALGFVLSTGMFAQNTSSTTSSTESSTGKHHKKHSKKKTESSTTSTTTTK